MDNIVPKYQLPFDSPEINPFILLAKNANEQAETATSYTNQSISLHDNTQNELLPSLPQEKTTYSVPVILTVKSLCTAIDSTIKARKAEIEALHNGLLIAQSIVKTEESKALLFGKDITFLNEKAEKLRSNFTNATDSPIISELSNSEAKTLLEILEKTYDKHNLLKNAKDKISETLTNIEYINSQLLLAKEQLKDLEAQQLLVNDKMNYTNSFFGINTECIKEEVPMQANVESQQISKSENIDEKVVSSEKRPSAGSLIWSYFKIILFALLLAFVIRAYVFDITRVEGLSMFPTLHDSDSLINSKIGYLFEEPQRGDIVVFDAPDSAGEDYVKRIIALPNEEIVIDRGMVYINGELLDEPYLGDVFTEGDIKTVVPDGFYFVMGDNRDISRDSRITDVGTISLDQIHGKAILRIFPFNSFGLLNK